MPHLILHYTANLDGFDPDDALSRINLALSDSGHFKEADIKSRALRLDHFRIGNVDHGRGFAHAHLKMLPGRDDDTRQSLAQAMLAALRDAMAHARYPDTQLCVELSDLDRPGYAKHVLESTLS